MDRTLNVWLYFLVCVSSLWAFFSFCTLAFVGFLLLSEDPIFMLSNFFLTTPMKLYIWLLVWLVCTLPSVQQQNFYICHSEYVFQICFLQLLYVHIYIFCKIVYEEVFCSF